jgi:dienelactone hydrolase
MRKILLAFLLIAKLSFAETITVNGATVDVFVSGNTNDSTVVYFPGCNGRNNFGKKYQDFHLEKIKEHWNNNVNVIRIQMVNDITKNATDGICFWNSDKTTATGVKSVDFVNNTAVIIDEWVKKQTWFNGNIHFFGFSYGGRVAMFANNLRSTNGMFKTVTGIWPICIEAQRFKANTIHTPTRIYSGINDAISEPKNCPSFYPDNGNKMLNMILYDTNLHSWMTHPDLRNQRVWWPNHKLWTKNSYDEELANKTWRSWTLWAKCMEKNTNEICNKE